MNQDNVNDILNEFERFVAVAPDMGAYVPEYIKPVYNLVLKNQLQTTESMKEGANIRTFSKIVENDFKLNGYD